LGLGYYYHTLGFLAAGASNPLSGWANLYFTCRCDHLVDCLVSAACKNQVVRFAFLADKQNIKKKVKEVL
jgi:hypothetical protein